MAQFSYDKELQTRIGRRVLILLAPLICLVATITSLVVFIETPEQWIRAIPGIISVCTLAIVWALAHYRKIREAMALLFAVSIFGLVFAMYLGGGVRAPFYTASICILAVAAWYYPRRYAMTIWAVYVLVGAFFVWLEKAGRLPLVSPPGTLAIYTFLAAYYTVTLLATITPNRMFHKELARSKAKQAEAEALARELERKERALAASERDLLEAQRFAHLGYWSRDFTTGQINWSAEIFRMVGIEPQPMTMELMLKHIHPGYARHFDATPPSEAAAEKEIEFQVIRPDGEVRWVYDHWTSVYGPDGAELFRTGISQDITERKHNEIMLRIQAELSRALLDAPTLEDVLRECTEAAISTTSLDCGGIYVEAESGAFRLGYSQGLSPEFLAATAYLPAESPNMELIRKKRPVYSLFTELAIVLDEAQRREGLRAIAVVPVTYRDAVIGCLNVASHTLDTIPQRSREALETIANHAGAAIVRAKAQDALRLNQNNLQTLFDSVDDFLTVLDMRGVILDVNKVVLDRLKYSRSDLLGQSILLLHPPDKSGEVNRILTKMASGITDVCHLPMIASDGTEVPVETRATRGEWNGQQVFFGTSRDITERLKAEKEKEALEEQLRQSHKMEAIGQLAGGIAHDFNNLLQVITGATELVMDDLGAAHPAREMTGNILEASERATELVGRLLAFSRRQVLRPKHIHVNDVIENLLKMLTRLIGADIRLEWLPSPEPDSVFADRSMLEQILMNLCVNARDAMPEGGTLAIATRRAPLSESYCTSNVWATPGDYLVISVRDTGCGIDKEALPHIFEPFFTTKPQGKGTGLGLAMVYGIVRQHNGMIFPRSIPGKGASFEIYLPASESHDEPEKAAQETSPAGGTETILLAEDDPPVREIAGEILRRAGYRVLEAGDGVQAIERIQEHAKDIRLALLDVVMPTMGGREVYEFLREHHPNIPVLFVSGYSDAAIHTNFILESGVTLLAKPLEQTELLRQVRALLDRNGAD